MADPAKRVHVPVATRRAQLVEAAVAVMLREGAWALTTRAVATEADVPLGAVHYAFDSKAALISAVFGADIDSVAAVLHSALAGGGSAEQIVHRAMQRYAEELRASPQAELIVQELGLMGARDEELRGLAEVAVEGYRAEVVQFLEQVALADGAVWDGPITVVAESLFGQLVGLAQNWLCTGDDALLAQCLQDVATQLSKRLTTPIGSP